MRVQAGIALLFAGAALAATACGGDAAEPPPSEVTGLIVAIEGEGSDVRSFTLESDGEAHEIHIAPDVDYGFDLAHLHEHERDREPVRCDLEQREGRLYALTIDDA